MKSVSGRHGMADEMLYTIRVLRSKLARMKKEQRDGGGVLFRSPKENQKGRHNGCVDLQLLARPLKAAIPDALHPGKAGEPSPWKSSLFPGDFPGFHWARSSQAFRNSSVTRDDSLVLSVKQLREEWVQGIIPWRGVQGPRRPLPRPPVLMSLFAIFVLEREQYETLQ